MADRWKSISDISSKTAFFISGLAVVLLTGCKSFDPTPYQQSLAKVRQVAADTADYEARWHLALIEACEANHTQAMEVLKAKLISEVFDNLLKGKEPISADDQDVYFPVDGNRSAARIKWIKSLDTIITNYTVELEIAGAKDSFDLIKLFKEEKSASANFGKLTAPQRQFYSDGIAKLKAQIITIPLIEQHEKDFAELRKSIETHKEFASQLARQHGELEQEMIGGLQSAASALEANAWIVQIGNKALSGLNGLLGKTPQPPPTEAKPMETKP